MDKIKQASSNIGNNFKDIANTANQGLENNSKKLTSGFKNNIMKIAPFGTEKFLKGSSEFLNSNTLIGKATFLLFAILVFIGLFGLLSRLLYFLMSPSETPYILWGMKSGSTPMVISQSYANKKSIPLFRSKNEFDGIEFTYAFWIFVESNKGNSNDSEYKHIFHKGSINTQDPDLKLKGMYAYNNSPGVYLYTGKDDITETALKPISNPSDMYKIMSMLIRVNLYQNSKSVDAPYKYYEDIKIEGIPIKKWCHVVIRSTSQKILDVYMNGKIVKRQRLTNVIKQNYDNLYVNLNGGFDGFMSNIKYWNHAIGTFEIDNIVKRGPNLKMANKSPLHKSKPSYLSNKWYFNEGNY